LPEVSVFAVVYFEDHPRLELLLHLVNSLPKLRLNEQAMTGEAIEKGEAPMENFGFMASIGFGMAPISWDFGVVVLEGNRWILGGCVFFHPQLISVRGEGSAELMTRK
jgi:hypothetical protein